MSANLKTTLKRSLPYLLILLVTAGVIGTTVGGCNTIPTEDLRKAREILVDEVERIEADILVIQTELAKLDANDPVRKQLEDALNKLQAQLAKGREHLPLIDAAIRSAETGEVDPLVIKEASRLPIVGGYVGLGAALLALWRSRQKLKAEVDALQANSSSE
jgi:hypothetical protein